MAGNVWEWVQDCWNANYNDAPQDGPARNTGDCERRVIRGGSWHYIPKSLRSAFRDGFNAHTQFDSFGVRVGRTLAP
jgi:formylglycine-generating enzyme required for sulfatase activity